MWYIHTDYTKLFVIGFRMLMFAYRTLIISLTLITDIYNRHVFIRFYARLRCRCDVTDRPNCEIIIISIMGTRPLHYFVSLLNHFLIFLLFSTPVPKGLTRNSKTKTVYLLQTGYLSHLSYRSIRENCGTSKVC